MANIIKKLRKTKAVSNIVKNETNFIIPLKEESISPPTKEQTQLKIKKPKSKSIRLTENQLKVFELYFIGMSQKEIAEELKCSANYVCKTLKIVCKRLKIELNQPAMRFFREDLEEIKRRKRWWDGEKRRRVNEAQTLLDELYRLNFKYIDKLKEKVNAFL